MSGLFNVSKKFFSSWKPNLPKHKIVFNTTQYHQAHAIWNLKDAENVQQTHLKPKGFSDRAANLYCVLFRYFFDFVSGYKHGKMTESLYLRRFIFLETIAGVPGMVGGMVRHLNSLRNLRHDGGWIHHLVEEAENERMHLLTFLRIRVPGIFMRLSIVGTQFIFVLWYSIFYSFFPKTSHRFVGYLEEQAVLTYTMAIKDLDEGRLEKWANLQAPSDAIKYWGLGKEAKFRDMLLSIRADEANHREYNHHFADIPGDEPLDGHKIFISTDFVGEANNKWEDEEVKVQVKVEAKEEENKTKTN